MPNEKLENLRNEVTMKIYRNFKVLHCGQIAVVAGQCTCIICKECQYHS